MRTDIFEAVSLLRERLIACLTKRRSGRMRHYISDEKFRSMPNTFSWMGVNWIVHSSLPGIGTNAEKCFMYHRSAIGHAVDASGIDNVIGYDEEQAYSFSRTSAHMGSKLLQNSGVVVITHDGSGFAAQ